MIYDTIYDTDMKNLDAVNNLDDTPVSVLRIYS